MTDLSEELSLDEPFGLASTDVINDQTDSMYNSSINGTSASFNNDFRLGNDTMRILFFAIATITILICLTICISVCICICLNRRRNLKRQEKKDHCLLPEQSEKISPYKIVAINSSPKNLHTNNKQQLSSSNIINGKTPIQSCYYDNFDDIPFIDESRPTSYIDITRV